MLNVANVMGIKKLVLGDLGVEIEVEGENLPICTKFWSNEEDGSLQGHENREYVLIEPTDLAGLNKALDYLNDRFIKNNTRMEETVRAGVHVHINCQRMTMTQLFTYMTLYLCLENVLVKWCGESREGNVFCLRASDAEGVVTTIIEAIRTGRFQIFFKSNDIRYASMNVKALGDYGSLEFRAMRSTKKFSDIVIWAEVLLHLRLMSRQFETPDKVIEEFSVLGPTAFLKKMLGNYYKTFSCQDEQALLFDGMRNAQEIAFCVNWEGFEDHLNNTYGRAKSNKLDGLVFDPGEWARAAVLPVAGRRHDVDPDQDLNINGRLLDMLGALEELKMPRV